MFDCPLASQTSPTRMSATFSVAPSPCTCSTYGPPAACAGSFACQRPLASAFAVACLPSRLTVSVAPGVAQPHTGIG